MYIYHSCIILLCSLLLLLPSSLAHMYLSSLTVDGTALNEGDCVRMVGSNSPITDVNSQDMTCGFKPNADKPANRKCPVTAGTQVGMQWYHESPSPTDDIVDPSHKGPCTVYMAKDNNDGNPKWFKIWQTGYNVSTSKFCTETLIANRGYMQFTIPSDLTPGNYLLRGETIALHESNQIDGAQFYIACAELTISGKGKATPATVALPGAYKDTDPGLYIPNFYNNPNFANYVVPGPSVYTSSSGPSDGKDGRPMGSRPSGSSISTGGAIALAFFLLALVGILAFAALFYVKNGSIFGKQLPSRLHTFLHNPSNSRNSRNSRNGEVAGRGQSNYEAFVDDDA